MFKLNYWYQGFVGEMQTKTFDTEAEAKTYLEENKNEINTLTANILPAD